VKAKGQKGEGAGIGEGPESEGIDFGSTLKFPIYERMALWKEGPAGSVRKLV
jgi:hypothetical protein